MKESLEDFVKNNRDQFDDEIPSEKVWQEMEQGKKKAKSVRLYQVFSFAAAAALVAAVSVVFIQSQTIKSLKENKAVEQNVVERQTHVRLPIELQEAEAFYSIQVAEGLKRLSEHPDEAEEVKAELQALDEEYEELKAELGKGFTQANIIEAMIENYRLKLDILETTMEHIKRNENHEKSNEQYS